MADHEFSNNINFATCVNIHTRKKEVVVMKLKAILSIVVAALFAASCSTSLQQRRVADELYETPDRQVQQENYMTYYDDAENILKEGTQESVDSVIIDEQYRSTGNPYQDILVEDYDRAYDLRMEAMSDLSYGMSDFYGIYNSDAFWYASAYDPSFYNVIVMGDHVWVEPKYLTSHFGSGFRYGSFYNYPYNPFSSFSPYSGSLAFTGIYGFNTFGSYSGFNAYRYGLFSNYGYSPYFGMSSYYGFSPFMSNYNSYYNYYTQDMLRQLEEEFRLNEEGRRAKYSSHSNRYRKSGDPVDQNRKAASFIRMQNDRKANRSIRTASDNERSRTGTSQYVRTRKSNSSLYKPRYNRPNREANYERVRTERSRSFTNSNSNRKSGSVYRTSGRSRGSSVSSSGNSSGRKSGSSGSSGSGSSGRKRK